MLGTSYSCIHLILFKVLPIGAEDRGTIYVDTVDATEILATIVT
jgi:hypothetical protein